MTKGKKDDTESSMPKHFSFRWYSQELRSRARALMKEVDPLGEKGITLQQIFENALDQFLPNGPAAFNDPPELVALIEDLRWAFHHREDDEGNKKMWRVLSIGLEHSRTERTASNAGGL